MSFTNMKHIRVVALICFILLGCATRCTTIGRHDAGGHIEPHEISDETAEMITDEITEEESKEWITLRKAPVKEAGGRYVYFTFDDGPSPNTNQILDILSDFQIKGTFFFVGKEILENEFMDYESAVAALKRVLAEGHFVGLHSMTHNMQRLYRATEAHNNFYNEMRELQSLIYELTGGYETSLYRAPYGTRGMFTRDHIRMMAESGMKAWDWNVDTEDWRRRTVDAILRKIKEDMEGRKYPDLVVILFHEHNLTISTLPVAIEYFIDLGYTFLPYHPDNHFQMNLLYNPDL